LGRLLYYTNTGWYSSFAWTWSTVGGKFIMVQTQTTCTSTQSALCASLTSTPTSGAAWTWIAGCTAPNAAGLVGTWYSNVGNVITIAAITGTNSAFYFSITPNFWLPGAFPTNQQAGLPVAAAPTEKCMGQLNPWGIFPFGSKNVSPYTRVGGNVTCGSSSFVFAVDVSSFNLSPSNTATGAAAFGTAFTLQLQLAQTQQPIAWSNQPALNTTAVLTSGGDFAGRVNGVPIYATDYLWAPSGNPCANPKQKLNGALFGQCVNPSSTVQASVLAVIAAMVAVLALAF